jgi:hypothetical protein
MPACLASAKAYHNSSLSSKRNPQVKIAFDHKQWSQEDIHDWPQTTL